MTGEDRSEDRGPGGTADDPWGAPTDWSLVAEAAGAPPGSDAEASWRALLERYRRPVRGAVLRRLRGPDGAEELADGFFSYLYSGKVLARASPGKGRFRCYLQGVLKRYLAHVRAEEAARRLEPLEQEPAVTVTPEIERQEEADWAEQVLASAVERLRRESARGADLLLRTHGIAPYPRASAAALGAEHGLAPGAVHTAVSRARARLRQLVLDEVRSTVASRDDFALETKVIVARLLEAYSHVFAEPE
jgi:DNA-directed RNA polymerase specialized sigma24 family protein